MTSGKPRLAYVCQCMIFASPRALSWPCLPDIEQGWIIELQLNYMLWKEDKIYSGGEIYRYRDLLHNPVVRCHCTCLVQYPPFPLSLGDLVLSFSFFFFFFFWEGQIIKYMIWIPIPKIENAFAKLPLPFPTGNDIIYRVVSNIILSTYCTWSWRYLLWKDYYIVKKCV